MKKSKKYYAVTPPNLERSHRVFTSDEMRTAHRFFFKDEAIVEQLIKAQFELTGEYQIAPDTLNSLSLMGGETSEKVRHILNETKEEEAERIKEFSLRFKDYIV